MAGLVGVVSFFVALLISYQVFPDPGTGSADYAFARFFFTISITAIATIVAKKLRETQINEKRAQEAEAERQRKLEKERDRERKARKLLEDEQRRRRKVVESAQARVGQLQHVLEKRERAQRESNHRDGLHAYGVVADELLANLVWRELRVPHERREHISAEQMEALTGEITINQPQYPPRDIDLEGLQYATKLSGIELNHPQGQMDLAPIAGLKNLRDLTVWGGADMGSIDALATLVGLHSLSLVGLTSVADYRPLAGLLHLTTLKINKVAEPFDFDVLSDLSNLRRLEITNMLHSQDLEHVSGLTQLEEVVLRSTGKIKSLKPLEKLGRIRRLHLEALKLEGSEQLRKLTKLRALILREVSGVGDLQGLEGLSRLHELELSGVRLDPYRFEVGSLDLSPLGGLTSLRSLNLSQNGYTNFKNWPSISGLINLSHLDVAADLYGTDGLDTISRLSQLDSLRLDCAIFPDLEPIGRLSQLKTLELVGEWIDTGPSTLDKFEAVATLQRLESLRLDTVGGRDLVREVGRITSLKHLELTKVYLRDYEDLESLANLTNLETLELRENARLVLNLAPLADLPSLTTLTLITSGYGAQVDTSPLDDIPGLTVKLD